MWENRLTRLATLYLITTTVGILTCDARNPRHTKFHKKHTPITDISPTANNLDDYELITYGNDEGLHDEPGLGSIVTDIEIRTPANFDGTAGNKGRKSKRTDKPVKKAKPVKTRNPVNITEINNANDEDTIDADLDEDLEDDTYTDKPTGFFMKCFYGFCILASIAVVGFLLYFLYTNYFKSWFSKLKNKIGRAHV